MRFEPCGIPLCDNNGCVPASQETLSVEMTTTSFSTISKTSGSFETTAPTLPANSSSILDEEEIDVIIVDNRGVMPSKVEFEIRSKIFFIYFKNKLLYLIFSNELLFLISR